MCQFERQAQRRTPRRTHRPPNRPAIARDDSVHHPGDVMHVEIIAVAPDVAQFILHTDINNESSRCHETVGGDQFTKPYLVRHIEE